MESYVNQFQYQYTDSGKKYLQVSLNEFNNTGNGRFATNLDNEIIQAQAMRLMTDENGESLVEKVNCLEKEDVKRALNKLRNGES